MAARTAALSLAAALCAALALATDGTPPPDEVPGLVAQLGDGRFAVRETAMRRLWALGKPAEAALTAAAKSADAEVARRAKEVLEKFQWGLYPDTPAAVAAQIDRYRTGDDDVRREAVHALMKLGRPGYVALAHFSARAADAETKELLGAAMTHAAQTAVPALLVAGDYATAETILEACLIAAQDDAVSNFAAFHLLRGTLPAAVGRAEADFARTPTDRNAELLTGLLRVRNAPGDADRALAVVATTPRGEVADAILWERNDWAKLAARPLPAAFARQGGTTTLGLLAAYHRLAGHEKEFADHVAELRKAGAAAADADDRGEAANALLLNEQVDDGFALLNLNPAAQFDLLVARLRYADALKLAAEQTKDKAAADHEMLRRHGRALLTLGETERGRELLGAAARKLTAPRDADDVAEVIKAAVWDGQRDQARAIAAGYLDGLAKLAVAERHDPLGHVLAAVFPKRDDVAKAWWKAVASETPAEPAAARLAKVAALVDDPAPGAAPPAAGPVAALLRLAAAGDRTERVDRVEPSLAYRALAHAADVAGRPAEAERWLRTAAEQVPGPAARLHLADFLRDRRRFADAAAEYEAAWKFDPAQPLPLHMHGRMLELAGRAEAGRAMQAQAHWLPLGHADARVQFAKALAARDLPEAARRERAFAARVGGPNAGSASPSAFTLARDAEARKDYAAAADLYDRAVVGYVRSGSNYASQSAAVVDVLAVARRTRARAALDAGRPDDALAAARKALAILPGNVDVAIVLVAELARRGRPADADALYAAVVGPHAALAAAYPNSAFAHNSLAWTAACCRRDLAAAQAHAERAVALVPANAGYLDTLAEVLFQRGDAAAAMAAMKRCVAMEPKNAYFGRQLARFAAGDRTVPPPPEAEAEDE